MVVYKPITLPFGMFKDIFGYIRELETSLGYLRHCLKRTNKIKNKQQQKKKQHTKSQNNSKIGVCAKSSQGLRATGLFAEVEGLIPSTHRVAHKHL